MSSISPLRTDRGKKLGYRDRCRLRRQPGFLSTLANAASGVGSHEDGRPRIGPLIRSRGDMILRVGQDDPGPALLARVLYVHALRTGGTLGQAFDDLYTVEVIPAEPEQAAA